MQIQGLAGGPFQTNTYVVVGKPGANGRPEAFVIDPGTVSYTHLTLPTTPYV